jgi:hypothetical protein
MNKDTHQSITLCYCDDGCLAAAVAGKNKSKKWEIFSISRVYGQGSADYERNIFNATYDKIVLFNSFSGVSYIAVYKNELWGLIRLRWLDDTEYMELKNVSDRKSSVEPSDLNTVYSLDREIKMIEEIKFNSIDELIKKYSLNNEQYDIIDKE